MKSLPSVALALALSLPPASASADPSPPKPKHFLSPSTVTTDGGSTVRLDPGYYLTEPLWDHFDLELKRLQTAETRLKAENDSLRASGPTSVWWKIAGFAAGVTAGVSAVKWGDDFLRKLQSVAE